MSDLFTTYATTFDEGMAAFNRGDLVEAKRILTKAYNMLQTLIDEEKNDMDLKKRYEELSNFLKSFIDEDLSIQENKAETSIPVVPEIIDTANQTSVKTEPETEKVETLADWGVKTEQPEDGNVEKTELSEISHEVSSQDQDIPKVDKFFNEYVATFDKAMDAFNRGVAVESKRLFTEALSMLVTLADKETDVQLKAKYINLHKEIEELIAMHLSEKESTEAVQQKRELNTNVQIEETNKVNKQQSAQPLSMLDKHYTTFMEGYNAGKNGDIDKARTLITKANEMANDIVTHSKDSTIREQYNIIYERTEKLLNNKLAKTKIEVEKTFEDMEK